MPKDEHISMAKNEYDVNIRTFFTLAKGIMTPHEQGTRKENESHRYNVLKVSLTFPPQRRCAWCQPWMLLNGECASFECPGDYCWAASNLNPNPVLATGNRNMWKILWHFDMRWKHTQKKAHRLWALPLSTWNVLRFVICSSKHYDMQITSDPHLKWLFKWKYKYYG